MEDIEKLSYNEAISKLKQNLDILENNHENIENQSKLILECLKLKSHCQNLLKKEKEEIIKDAKENKIPQELLYFKDENDKKK